MTDHPHQLYAVEFTEADQARLAGFSCGDESWSRCAAEWIQGSDVLESMKKATKVWLFENAEAKIVGFGSVGPARWRWPLPDGEHCTLVLIPMLGVDKCFLGQPADPEWRYSRQIISHLISTAMEISRAAVAKSASRINWLVLLVHQDNHRAIKFYENCGFERIPNVVRHNNHLVMKLWIGESPAE